MCKCPARQISGHLPYDKKEDHNNDGYYHSGIGGRMGHVLCEMIAQREDCRVVAGIDMKDGEMNGIPVYDSLDKLDGKGDVVIDFSAPAAVEKALPYCEAHKLPIVVCTTGLSEELQLKLVQLSRSIPVFKSANMSMGINVLSELCKRASAILGANYDIEIVEQHHHNKLDAPSGTALMLLTPSTKRTTAHTITSMTAPPSARSATPRRSASAPCAAAASWATMRCCSAARMRSSPSAIRHIPAIFLQMAQ